MLGGQPELGVVGEAERGVVGVERGVHAQVVRLVPLVQRAVHLLHDVVQDAAVRRVANEQHLEQESCNMS